MPGNRPKGTEASEQLANVAQYFGYTTLVATLLRNFMCRFDTDHQAAPFDFQPNWDTLHGNTFEAFGAFICIAILCLTNPVGYWNIAMKTYSTVQVAELLDIGTDTLHRWMREKKVPRPPIQSMGGMSIRMWSEEDVKKARVYKADHYWGKGGRKKRGKRTE